MTTIIWSFRNRTDCLKKSIESANKTCPDDVKFILVDGASSDESHKEIRTFCSAITNRKICICETFYRTTCQEAWNLGIMLSDTRHLIISSSDVVFNPGWYEAISEPLLAGRKYVLLQNHAVFGINRSLISEIGFFDENFKHGAHVDVDFMIRASEAGIYPQIVDNNGFYLHDEENISYKDRIKKEDPDKLNINSSENEKIFKNKWETTWQGWDIFKDTDIELPHPPTNIKQVKRKIKETDFHPAYMERTC